MEARMLTDTNQHYITKAHLDKFVHSSSAQEVLYPYRKGGNPCKPRGTKKLGSATNFYRQRVDGELSDQLDEARKASETLLFSSGKRNAGPLAQCIFDDDFSPTESDRLHLAATAAFLYCGSPVQVHNTAMNSLFCAQVELLNRLNSAEAVKSYGERYGAQAVERIDQDRQKVLKGELFADVGRENWKQLGFYSFQIEADVIRLLLDMSMTIVNCHYRSFFLTSDNPAVRTFESAQNRNDDEMWFPISHSRGILWHRRRLGTKIGFGHAESRALNRRVIKHAYKFIYSPLAESWVEEAARNETFDPLLGHYGSLEQVFAQALPAIGPDDKPCGEIVEIFAAMKSGEKPDVVGV
jgi:hypothetical protein